MYVDFAEKFRLGNMAFACHDDQQLGSFLTKHTPMVLEVKSDSHCGMKSRAKSIYHKNKKQLKKLQV